MKFIDIPRNYAYFIGSLYFLGLWIFVFLRVPRHRLAMVVFGLGASWIGLLGEYFWWTRDWWHPLTLTGTVIGIEDFIMCFTHLGIASFIYKALSFQDTEDNFQWKKQLIKKGIKRFAVWFSVSFPLTLILFYVFSIHSFTSTILGMLVAGLFVIQKRRDLFFPMLWSSFAMVLFTLPVYFMGQAYSPGTIDSFWDTSISGVRFLSAPAEDIVWYGALGFFLGGAYEYLFDFHLKKI